MEPYSEDLANAEYVESLYLPRHQGEEQFSIILTDSAGDGVCCNFGPGGPIELYEGSYEDGQLMFTTPFGGIDREVHSFVIVRSSALPLVGGILSIALVLINTLVSSFWEY